MIRNRDGSKWCSGVSIANTIVYVPDRAGNEPSDPFAPAISGLSGKEWEEVCSSSHCATSLGMCCWKAVANLRFSLLPVYISVQIHTFDWSESRCSWQTMIRLPIPYAWTCLRDIQHLNGLSSITGMATEQTFHIIVTHILLSQVHVQKCVTDKHMCPVRFACACFQFLC